MGGWGSQPQDGRQDCCLRPTSFLLCQTLIFFLFLLFSFALMLLSLGTVTATTTACLSTPQHHPFVSLDLDVPQDLILSQRSTEPLGVGYDAGSSPNLAQVFLYSIAATWLWPFMLVLPASTSHPVLMCWIDSRASFASFIFSCPRCLRRGVGPPTLQLVQAFMKGSQVLQAVAGALFSWLLLLLCIPPGGLPGL